MSKRNHEFGPFGGTIHDSGSVTMLSSVMDGITQTSNGVMVAVKMRASVVMLS